MKFLNCTNLGIITVVCFIISSCGSKQKNHEEISSQKDCIAYIIRKDDSLGSIRNHACEAMSLSKSITQYVSGIDDLDFSNCPKSFVDAFAEHKKAWRNMKKVTDSLPNLRGEMHDVFDSISKTKYNEAFDPLLKDVWDTWAQIEQSMKSL